MADLEDQVVALVEVAGNGQLRFHCRGLMAGRRRAREQYWVASCFGGQGATMRLRLEFCDQDQEEPWKGTHQDREGGSSEVEEGS